MIPCKAVGLNSDIIQGRSGLLGLHAKCWQILHESSLIACHGHVRGLAINDLRFSNLAAWLADDRLGSAGYRRLPKPLKLRLLATVATSKCSEDRGASKHHGPDKQQPETDLVVGGLHPRDIDNSGTAAGVEMRVRLEHVQHPRRCNQPYCQVRLLGLAAREECEVPIPCSRRLMDVDTLAAQLPAQTQTRTKH